MREAFCSSRLLLLGAGVDSTALLLLLLPTPVTPLSPSPGLTSAKRYGRLPTPNPGHMVGMNVTTMVIRTREANQWCWYDFRGMFQTNSVRHILTRGRWNDGEPTGSRIELNWYYSQLKHRRFILVFSLGFIEESRTLLRIACFKSRYLGQTVPMVGGCPCVEGWELLSVCLHYGAKVKVCPRCLSSLDVGVLDIFPNTPYDSSHFVQN